MYLTYRFKKLLVVFLTVVMIAFAAIFVFVDFGSDSIKATPVTTISSVSTLPSTTVDNSYQNIMTMNCQRLIIPFHKDTNNDFSLSSVHSQCFKWYADQLATGVFNKIVIEGRSSCDDTPDRGYEISKQRAEWAARQLLVYGVPFDLIELLPLSYEQPLLEKGDCSYGPGADHNRSVLIRGE